MRTIAPLSELDQEFDPSTWQQIRPLRRGDQAFIRLRPKLYPYMSARAAEVCGFAPGDSLVVASDGTNLAIRKVHSAGEAGYKLSRWSSKSIALHFGSDATFRNVLTHGIYRYDGQRGDFHVFTPSDDHQP